MKAMLLAFLLNGICPFGLRILTGIGNGQDILTAYLFYWYLAGFILIILLNWRHICRPTKGQLVVGIGMGAASVGGQLFMGLSMAYGAAGGVVYMLGMGASICIVSCGGVLLFKEHVGIYGKLGILLGLIAAALLAVES